MSTELEQKIERLQGPSQVHGASGCLQTVQFGLLRIQREGADGSGGHDRAIQV